MKTIKEENKKKRSAISTALVVAGSAAFTVVGVVVIPSLLKKYSNKLYKFSIKKNEIDFDNLGPEIVRKEETEE